MVTADGDQSRQALGVDRPMAAIGVGQMKPERRAPGDIIGRAVVRRRALPLQTKTAPLGDAAAIAADHGDRLRGGNQSEALRGGMGCPGSKSRAIAARVPKRSPAAGQVSDCTKTERSVTGLRPLLRQPPPISLSVTMISDVCRMDFNSTTIVAIFRHN